MKKPRNTHPKHRPTRRAATTNWDIIKLATFHWDIATHAEQLLDGLVIHNAQQKVHLALISKSKQTARALGYHLEPPNPNAFKTAELTNILYEQGLAKLQVAKSKQIAATARSSQAIHFE
jgi:hypothetical protein